MPIAPEAYEELALQKEWRQYELRDGELVEKPVRLVGEGDFSHGLAFRIIDQVDRERYATRINSCGCGKGYANYLLPDVSVYDCLMDEMRAKSLEDLEAVRGPVVFVADVWSLPTRGYDVESKPPIYRRRGDHEIWHVDPIERTVTIWRRQEDGSYLREEVTGGTVTLHALPRVSVDLDALWPKRG